MKLPILTGISLLIVCSVPTLVKAETMNCSTRALDKGAYSSQAATRVQSSNSYKFNHMYLGTNTTPCNYNADGTQYNSSGITNNYESTTNNLRSTEYNSSEGTTNNSGDASK